MGASKEDPSRMEGEIYNMRKEMDELKRVVKEEGMENLDGMTQSTDSSFPTYVLNFPRPPKSVAEPFYKAQKYLNAEDAVVTKEMTSKKKTDEGTSCLLKKKKETQSPKQTSDGKRTPK